jgi:hypothetical protein
MANKLEIKETKDCIPGCWFLEKKIFYDKVERGSVLEYTNFQHPDFEKGYDVVLDGKCFILPRKAKLKKEILKRIEG